MTHARAQIRSAVATTLAGLTTTGSRVYQSRVYPVAAEQLPCLCIYTHDETVDTADGRIEGVQMRTLTMVVAGVVSGISDDGTMDTISEEVETAMLADRFLGNRARALDLVSTQIEISGELDQLRGVIQMAFEIQYFTADGSPGTII